MVVQLPKDTLRAIRVILLADEKLTVEQALELYEIVEKSYNILAKSP